jgi:tRNA(fMet)-specific endonuclease VapC
MTLLLIDTDICSYAIKSQHGIAQRLFAAAPGSWAISSITHHELSFGASLDGALPKTVENVARFLGAAKILDFDTNASVAAALVRKNLRSQGKPSGAYDELIAGHALALDATLITNNLKHFERVPGLKSESWL